ncbi:putative disease resistance protein RGA3 [Vitis riparia]|uniref:putative disease resistance protein RGA3 n=1 Tax=Vitis riparia TaxID=96939 RepID=UPI00155A5549|nr:putative disease resistance protein RGA3 [Vitis riparia]
MAESFLFSIADNVVGKIGSVTLQEIGLAWGVKTELQKLEATLTAIKSVLLDAEEKQWKDRQLRDWLGKLKHVCYDVEDVLDEFRYQALQRQVVSHGSLKTKVLGFFSSSNPLPFSFKMGHRIKEVRERLDGIAADRAQFNLQTCMERAPMVYRETTHSFVLASDVIGRDKDKEKVLELLMNSSDDDERISVIPIVGLGGLGKTTLAKLVYNDPWVVGHFKKRIWVCVSNDFDMKKVIIDIIKSIKTTVEGGSGLGLPNHNDLNMEQAQTLLRRTLGNENFFLVLDDMWNEDRQKWIELRTFLMNGAKGNKIVVTTRCHPVASIMGTVPAYILEGLPHVDCLSVFLKWAFNEGQEKQHPNLVKIGDDIVKKCNGVPLAARTLGSLLFSKFEQRDWLDVRDNDIWKLEQKEGDILPALRLSYEQLPSYLKCCFAYCSIFPKDRVLTNEQLVDMWSAQGLIESSKKKQELDDIGNKYIKEMLSRSFFQDFEDRHYYFTFKMHDLMHDLASFISQTECTVIDCVSQTVSRMVRHVSFSYDLDEKEILSVVGELNDIRTIYFPFVLETSRGEPFLKACISKFKCIKTLDLSGSNFDTLPNSISNLKHLRLLNLMWNKKIKKLPNSVCKLFHLQTLLLQGCEGFENLPKEFGNLISLRQLGITMKQRVLTGIGRLESLRILRIFKCENLEFLLQGTQSLTALRLLVIVCCRSLETLAPSMKQLPSLERLVIFDCERLNSLDGNGEDHVRGLRNLRVLLLGKLPKLEALPEWMRNLTSLDRLVIEECPQLSKRCKKTTGEDWHKISHVSKIYIDGIKTPEN